MWVFHECSIPRGNRPDREKQLRTPGRNESERKIEPRIQHRPKSAKQVKKILEVEEAEAEQTGTSSGGLEDAVSRPGNLRQRRKVER